MDHIIAFILIAVSAAMTPVVTLPILKILQLSGYKAGGVFEWWKATSYNSLIRYIGLTMFAFIAIIVYVGCFSAYEYARYCAVILYVILSAVFIASSFRGKQADVKYTGRLIRLIVAVLIIDLALGVGVAAASYYSPYCQTLVAALGVLSPFVAFAANAIMTPFEKLNNKKYIKRAVIRLNEVKPTVIGITGSYGKTTAKSLLAAMLKDMNVLATPGSFNTPMGVCKTINESLTDQKYFIAELGARRKGDIKELCDIVSPSVGIITAVGDMHLATFKTRENVASAKFELAEALPKGGLIILNGYNEDAAKLKSRETLCDKCVTGEDISYSDLKLDGTGTTFTLAVGEERYTVRTALLGAHIPELVCVCVAAAIRLGVSVERAVECVESAEPVDHRLKLVPSVDPDVTVIDDAYNSNPIGAKNALEVLKSFDGKKVIITPGFVELGALEKGCNETLGRQIADACDRAFLIGSRAADIKSGAVAAGMCEGDISVFASRDEAVEELKTVTGKRVVLFENDLPDNIK